MRKRFLSRKSIIIGALIVVLADQASKTWVKHNLLIGRPIEFIPGLVRLNYIHNTGAAFSLFNNATAILTLISIAVAFALVIYIMKKSFVNISNGLGLAFLLGGSIGNGIDRLTSGYVIDFLELVPISFPIFNIADISINIAVLYFGLDILKNNTDEE